VKLDLSLSQFMGCGAYYIGRNPSQMASKTATKPMKNKGKFGIFGFILV
jgi:hypothetical protein